MSSGFEGKRSEGARRRRTRRTRDIHPAMTLTCMVALATALGLLFAGYQVAGRGVLAVTFVACIVTLLLSFRRIRPSPTPSEGDILREFDFDGNHVVSYPEGTVFVTTPYGELLRQYNPRKRPRSRRNWWQPSAQELTELFGEPRSYLEVRGILLSTDHFQFLTVLPWASEHQAHGVLDNGDQFSFTTNPPCLRLRTFRGIWLRDVIGEGDGTQQTSRCDVITAPLCPPDTMATLISLAQQARGTGG